MLTKLLLLTFCAISGFASLNQGSEDIITLPNGKIQGRFAKTFLKTNYLAFQEIPYASPPIGELRFKDPIPPKNWEGILNTTKNTKICHQSIPKDYQTEDCLYINVYTPVDDNLSKLSNLPVLFYIYGGAFTMGDGTYDSLGPEFFIDQNVIVVTFNYRLGAFGFLSTQDNVISGNQALKDQNLALRWVNINIHLFGGDPSKVTIMGESAGAASVGFHLISKKSKDLFRAAILESSTALCSWAIQRRPKEVAYQLAAALDSTFTASNSSEELLKLLQSVPVTDIKNAVIPGFPAMGIQIGQGNIWSPVLEPENENSFVTDYLDESVKNGDINQVPIIIGINSEELISLAADLTSFKTEMAKYDKNVSLLVNEDFNIAASDMLSAGDEIRSIYTSSTFEDNPGAAVRFRSDARYTTAVIRHAELQSKYTDVFFYQFSYEGTMGFNYNIHIDGAERVGHAEDVFYLWKNILNEDVSKFPETDVVTHNRLVTLWANFAKYLNPTPAEDDLFQNIIWPSVSPDNFQYLNINVTLTVETDPKEYKNWARVVNKYGNPPFITY